MVALSLMPQNNRLVDVSTILCILCHYRYFSERKMVRTRWQYMWWLIPYFLGWWGISWLSQTAPGGTGVLGFIPGMAAVAVLNLLIFYVAILQAVTDSTTRVYMLHFSKRGSRAP